MNKHEVYPNAPLVLVALEVRHPATEYVSQLHQRDLKSRLSDEFPIMRRAQQATIQMSPNGGAPEPLVEQFPKFFNRDNTIAISMRSSSVVIEATDYPGWERFREIAVSALTARAAVTPLDGVERIGLRYIDEIRSPTPEVVWEDWIDSSLLGPDPAGINLPLTTWQGLAVYGDPADQALVLRHGPFEGVAVDASELRRVRPVLYPYYFLLDIDSYWSPGPGTPEFDIGAVIHKADDLHEPVRTLFESMITSRYRDEVLRSNEN